MRYFHTTRPNEKDSIQRSSPEMLSMLEDVIARSLNAIRG